MTSPLTLLGTGAAIAATAAVNSGAHVLAAAGDANTLPVGDIITGGGQLSLTAILAFLAVKFARGELVVRDVAAANAALTVVAEERKNERAETEQARSSTAELTRDVLGTLGEVRTELTAVRAELEAHHRHQPGPPA